MQNMNQKLKEVIRNTGKTKSLDEERSDSLGSTNTGDDLYLTSSSEQDQSHILPSKRVPHQSRRDKSLNSDQNARATSNIATSHPNGQLNTNSLSLGSSETGHQSILNKQASEHHSQHVSFDDNAHDRQTLGLGHQQQTSGVALPTRHKDHTLTSSHNGANLTGESQRNGSNDMQLQDWEIKQKSLIDGVVNLKDTEETHQKWAPAVTHEVIKHHQHEIVQQKIYREIHNYSYYNHVQPILHTEVLPPRHFIQNPDGDGLIEIKASEIPGRVGKNRWWDIVQKAPPLSTSHKSVRAQHTEPIITEKGPYMGTDGVQRKETTIRYPPTLADLSNYSGEVQPVHFDHATGQRWLGEVTTMGKLKEQVLQMKIMESVPDTPVDAEIERKPVTMTTGEHLDNTFNPQEGRHVLRRNQEIKKSADEQAIGNM